MADTSLIAKIILRLQDDASRGLDTTRQRITGIGQEIDRVKTLMIGLFSFIAIKEGLENLVGLSDKFANLTARIKLATSSEQEFNTAQGELFNIAQRTRSAMDTVIGLYTKLQIGIKNLGGTQKQAFDATEAVTQALKISGATAAESSGGIQQFTQSIASGVFRGEEFNSVMENGTRLAQALADGLGVPIAALRSMAAAGELTSDRVIAALLSQKEVLAAEYAQLPLTVAGAWQKLTNQFLKYIGQSKDASEATHGIADSIGFVTDHLDGLVTLAVHAGEVLLTVFGANKLQALITYTEAMFAVRAATIATTAAAVEAAAAAAAEAEANVALAQSSVAAAEAQAAEAAATQMAILAAREAVVVRLNAINAQIAQTEATIAATAMAEEGTAAHYIHAEAVRKLTLAEQHRAIVLTELATLGAQQARVAAAATAATTAQATATEELAAAQAAAAAGTAAATSRMSAFAIAAGAGHAALVGLVAWEVGSWAERNFSWVKSLGGYIAGVTAIWWELVKAMRHPLSIDGWGQAVVEIAQLKKHFFETKEAVDGINKTPVPTIFERLKASANSMAEGIDAALTKTKDAAKSHAEEMVKPYDEAAKAITTAFDAQSTQIDADLKNRLYAIDYLAASEKQKIEETTQAVITAEFEKTAAALNTKIQLDQTWNETYGRGIELARQAGGDISALEQQGAEARIGSLQTVVNAYQASVDNMISEEHRLLDAVRHTAEERENLSRSVEDKVRALQQKGMGDVQAYADQQKQIDEKQAAAKKAILEGNFTDAKKFADEAIRLAESTAHAVDNVSKDGQGKTQRKEAVSENQAIAKSIEQLKESAALADRALSGLGNAQLAQAKSVAASLKGAKSGLAEFKGELDRVITDVNNKAQIKLSIDATAAQVEMDKLAALTAAKELTVKIKADPLNADKEIADLQAKLSTAKITVPAVVAFGKMRDEELAKIQEELRKSIAFLTAVPVGVDTSDAVASLEAMKARIDEKLSSPSSAAHTVNPDFDAVFKRINEIKQNTSSTHTVYINKVENNATGGLIQHLATGGRVAAQTFRRVIGAITGPGTGTSDDVPVMASNGEFVVKTEAVQHYGVNFMNALNNKQLPVAPGYAIGGAVGDVNTSPNAAGQLPSPQGETINLNFNFGSKTVTLHGARSAARELAVELRSLARVS